MKETFLKCSNILLIDEMRYVKPLQLFQDLVKTTQKERGRLIGLDVGDKYVGLALSDFDNKIASPFSVLVRKKSNISLMASDFESLISKYSLEGFVVGIPYDKNRVSRDAIQVKVFIDHLHKTKVLEGLNYTYWNENFTSQNVELLLKPLNLNHPVHSKTMLDKFAAVGILQGLLKEMKPYCLGFASNRRMIALPELGVSSNQRMLGPLRLLKCNSLWSPKIKSNAILIRTTSSYVMSVMYDYLMNEAWLEVVEHINPVQQPQCRVFSVHIWVVIINV
ncbi:YqgF/RNase H-like domain [Sesbania bispinosa]|nr:YqgF/RNase H-like domain [Sesbania bispinosa]